MTLLEAILKFKERFENYNFQDVKKETGIRAKFAQIIQARMNAQEETKSE